MSHPIDRRNLLSHGAALCAAGLGLPAAAQTKIPLIYSDTVPEQDVRAAILRDVFGAGLGPEFDFKPYFGATLFKRAPSRWRCSAAISTWPTSAPSTCKKQIPAWSLVATPYSSATPRT